MGNACADGWLDPGWQKAGRLGRTHPRRDPDARPAVHGEAVGDAAAVPDELLAPVGRRHLGRGRRGARRVRVANAERHHAGHVRVGVHDRHVVRAVLRGAVDRTVRVDRRVALVGGDQVVHVRLRIRPVPQRHDDVPLHAPRAGGRRRRVLARLDAVGPVGVHRQRAVAPDLRQPRVHGAARLPGLHAAVPGGEVRVEVAERLGNLSRGLVPQCVTSRAAVGVDHRADPLALALDVRRDAVPVRPRAGELVRSGDLEQGEPVLRRVVLRRRCRVGGHDRREVERRARLRLRLLGIHQPVAAHPDVVGGLRQIGEQVASRVVRHDDPGETGGQIAGLRDHPDPGLGAVGTGDHTGDVVAVHRDRPARRLAGQHRDDRRGDHHHSRDPDPAPGQHAPHHVSPLLLGRTERAVEHDRIGKPGQARARHRRPLPGSSVPWPVSCARYPGATCHRPRVVV